MFFRRKKPTIESFRWSTAGWVQTQADANNRAWKKSNSDIAVQKFNWEVSTGLPANWRDANALRDHLSKHPQPQMACVSVDVFQWPAGIGCAQYVTKEHMPPPSLGHRYIGMITMPFRDFYCNVFFVAPELGTTGMREVALAAAGRIQMRKQDSIPTIKSNEELEELYRKARELPPILSGSDDEQWDSAFPDHPVSRVRTYLRAFRESLTVDARVRSYPQFGC